MPINKKNNSKKSKSKKKFSQTAENNRESVDLEEFKSNLELNSLPNLNSFLLEQIETNLLNKVINLIIKKIWNFVLKETENSEFELLANYVEEILNYIEMIKTQVFI